MECVQFEITTSTCDWRDVVNIDWAIALLFGYDCNTNVVTQIKVTNTGSRTGDEVVFMFVKPPANSTSGLIRRLVGEMNEGEPRQGTTEPNMFCFFDYISRLGFNEYIWRQESQPLFRSPSLQKL